MMRKGQEEDTDERQKTREEENKDIQEKGIHRRREKRGQRARYGPVERGRT